MAKLAKVALSRIHIADPPRFGSHPTSRVPSMLCALATIPHLPPPSTRGPRGTGWPRLGPQKVVTRTTENFASRAHPNLIPLDHPQIGRTIESADRMGCRPERVRANHCPRFAPLYRGVGGSRGSKWTPEHFSIFISRIAPRARRVARSWSRAPPHKCARAIAWDTQAAPSAHLGGLYSMSLFPHWENTLHGNGHVACAFNFVTPQTPSKISKPLKVDMIRVVGRTMPDPPIAPISRRSATRARWVGVKSGIKSEIFAVFRELRRARVESREFGRAHPT